MFYILTSKIPYISNDSSDKKFLKIFIIGSIIYILLHYYLFRYERGNSIDKYRKYIYYVMFADLSITYLLVNYFEKKPPCLEVESDTPDEHPIPNNFNNTNYTDEQKNLIMRQLYDMKNNNMAHTNPAQVQAQAQAQAQAQTQTQAPKPNEPDPFIRKNITDTDSESTDTSSSSAEPESKTKTKSKSKSKSKSKTNSKDKKKQVSSDTDIPVYKS